MKSATIVEGLECKALDIPDILIFRSQRTEDARGFVQPTFNGPYFRSIGIDVDFIHENHCFSPRRGTMRGFHYQLPPYGQPKLIRVTRGAILDVNVDLRCGAPSFGKHVSTELRPDGWHSIYVPEGFAHCTLDDDSEVIFKLGSLFAPSHAHGLAWNDPDLAIDWPFADDQVTVLERDLDRPRFSELTAYFP